ncbi:hypothetical protein [Microbispora sp. NPDC049125]|uniref:hypothetical protein n=1 Tax=Microbispora sp. NPDC049125 TaxID=3154929 RepID=UPI0034664AFB
MSDYLQVQGHGGHTLVASGNTMTIDGKDTYDLTAVKAVAYQVVQNHLNGAYQGTDFKIQLKQDKRTRIFFLTTNHRDENIDQYRTWWLQLVERIEAIAVPRLVDEVVAAVRAGQTVPIGPAGARVVLSLEGVKKGGLFSKPVPWSQVTGTTRDGRTVDVLGSKAPGGAPVVIGQVLTSEWNSPVLPYVVSHLKG